jgi:hypothetical protein
MGSFFVILHDANTLLVDKRKDKYIHPCAFWIMVVVSCAAIMA